jgi:hypothetical protein
MKTFKKRFLVTALAGASVLGLAGAAQAVNVNPDGLGQVLIYPYYTVRSAGDGAEFNSLLSVVNSTPLAKAVKVRFLEGKNSKEVLDFNLFLSAYDVWTAAIVPTANGGAQLLTSDTSCTVPNNISGQIFLPYQYQNDPVAATPTLYDRTQEGYVELIEMGHIIDTTPLKTAVTHVENAAGKFVPANCAHGDLITGNGVDVPIGGLFGSMTLVNPKGGLDVAYDPVSLDDFSSSRIFWGASSINPNLGHADPVSVVTDGKMTYVTDWSFRTVRDGAAATSAVLMHETLYNEYVTKGIAAANTEWVVTLPTKTLFYDKDYKVQELFEEDFKATGACDEMTTLLYGREEERTEGQLLPSPLPPGPQANRICWEVNVIKFTDKAIFGSKNAYDLPPPYDNGWASLTFEPKATNYPWAGAPAASHMLVADGANTTVLNAGNGTVDLAVADVTYYGLPMIGFGVQVFNNGYLDTAAGKVNANYAGRLNHKFSRYITD